MQRTAPVSMFAGPAPILVAQEEGRSAGLARAAFSFGRVFLPPVRAALRVEMKWKLWVSSLSVSGPRVAVRPQLPWPLRAALTLAALSVAFAAGVAVSAFQREPGTDLRVELERVHSQLGGAIAERDREAATAASWESQWKVERSSQDQVRVQMKALEDENAQLRADLAFFESLLPMPAHSKGVVIRSFRVQAEGDENLMRYRLLVQQSGRPDRDFVGSVALTVNIQHDGQPAVVQLPDPSLPGAGPAALAVRRYQRIEGTFTVPAGATVRSVLVRIQSGGETRAQQTFTL
jgi:hypothetical protein